MRHHQSTFNKGFIFILKTLCISAIITLGSCNDNQDNLGSDQDDGLGIFLEIEAIGHQFIYIKEVNYIGYALGGSTTLYYDTVDITDNSPFIETLLDISNYPKLFDLKPGTTYYLKAYYNRLWSDQYSATTLDTAFQCNTTIETVTGDFSGSQMPFTSLSTQPDRITGYFSGDFVSCIIRFPERMGDIEEGIYTTINKGLNQDYENNKHNVAIYFDGIDVEYYAIKDQPLHLIAKPHTPDFFVEFCDMVFEDNDGNEFTVSGSLK